MPVHIGDNSKIGDNNAIGDNANVNISKSIIESDKSDRENKIWFVKHPWISAIICSLIASLIVFLMSWDETKEFVINVFS